jgi:hypothetical protein
VVLRVDPVLVGPPAFRLVLYVVTHANSHLCSRAVAAAVLRHALHYSVAINTLILSEDTVSTFDSNELN